MYQPERRSSIHRYPTICLTFLFTTNGITVLSKCSIIITMDVTYYDCLRGQRKNFWNRVKGNQVEYMRIFSVRRWSSRENSLSVCVFTSLPICLSLHLSVCLSACLSFRLSVRAATEVSVIWQVPFLKVVISPANGERFRIFLTAYILKVMINSVFQGTTTGAKPPALPSTVTGKVRECASAFSGERVSLSHLFPSHYGFSMVYGFCWESILLEQGLGCYTQTGRRMICRCWRSSSAVNVFRFNNVCSNCLAYQLSMAQEKMKRSKKNTAISPFSYGTVSTQSPGIYIILKTRTNGLNCLLMCLGRLEGHKWHSSNMFQPLVSI